MAFYDNKPINVVKGFDIETHAWRKGAGWLGDAVYDGDGKTSFGMDDYMADLDADNIAHLVTEEKITRIY